MADVPAPERKKLKSTHQPLPALPPLPPGWTEHSAPTGHKYYYNAATKQSTYTRPASVIAPIAPAVTQPSPAYPGTSAASQFSGPQDYAALAQSYAQGNNTLAPAGNPSYTVPPFQQDFDRRPQHHQRRQPEDRPKKKAVIPDCAPWILVYTKLGRRFVHNTETRESLWKFPMHIMAAVVAFDKTELDKKLARRDEKDEGTGANNVPVGHNSRRRRSASLQREDEAALAAMNNSDGEDGKVVPVRREPSNPDTTQEGKVIPARGAQGDENDDDSSEYEEIEVTDDEEEDEETAQPDPTNESQPADDAAVEFGEDDIAYQLAQMNAEYGLDPGEYDDGLNLDHEEGASGLELTHEDSTALFHDLLSDHRINPFAPWEPLLENPALVADERWTILPTTKSRKEAWDSWTRSQITALHAQRATEAKQNPRLPYLALLAEKAQTPKLYWPEFKRKYKSDPGMQSRDSKFQDREREKIYREHVARLKLPLSTRQRDLRALLAAQPLGKLNRYTDVAALPEEVRADVKFISLPADVRDEVVRAHVSTLEPPPEGGEDGGSAEERAEREKKARERERREKALREREERVREDKRRSERGLRQGMEMLREGERELEAAMRVGREGLRGQLFEERVKDGGTVEMADA